LVLEDKSESDLLIEGVQDTAVDIQKLSPMDPSEDLPSNLSHNPFVIRRIKLRSIRNKAWQRLDPPGGGWSLFGLHTGKKLSTPMQLFANQLCIKLFFFSL
jgi:hypothetical protein